MTQRPCKLLLPHMPQPVSQQHVFCCWTTVTKLAVLACLLIEQHGLNIAGSLLRNRLLWAAQSLSNRDMTWSAYAMCQ